MIRKHLAVIAGCFFHAWKGYDMKIIICGIVGMAVVLTSAFFAVRKSKKHIKKLYEGKEDEN